MRYLNLCSLFAWVLLGSFSLCWGQSPAPMYSFAHEQSSYQPLAAPTVLNPGVDYLGHDRYTVPLGFKFDFFGRPLHSVEVQRSGLVFFGAEDEFVAPFQPALTVLPGSQVGYQLATHGPCEQKIMKFEWKEMGVLGLDSVVGTASFQLWLYEGSQRLELRYGPRSSFPAGALFESSRYHADGPRLRVTRTGQMAVVLGSYASPELVQDGDTFVARAAERMRGLPPEGSVYAFIPLEDPQEPALRVGPNPTAGWLHLYLTSGECQTYQLTLADLLGRVHLRAESQAQDLTLDLSPFPPGWYLLHLHFRDGAHLKTIKLRLLGR